MRLQPWKPLALCLIAGMAGPAFPQAADTRVAVHNDWSVFVAGEPKECYIGALPATSVAKRDGKPTEVQRGDVRLYVTFRPSDSVTNEVSFTGGYPFKPDSTVNLAIGGETFKLLPGDGDGAEWAWTDPGDDSKAVAAMRRGANAKLTGTSSRGTVTEDTFSLSGFTAAVEDAAARCR
ncbi:MAG TPA: invasion associated locus B family protein [Methylomirabilota bacterium]|nr:invasion associated locus B family protein [Methylomirabilota bacterium]